MGDVVNEDVDLAVVERGGEKLFCHVKTDGQGVLFRHLIPFWEMLYRTVSVTRDGQKIGDTMARSIGTHGPIEIFGTGGLKDVFGPQAEPKKDQVQHLSAEDFQAGDRLTFSVSCAPGYPFSKILENVGFYIGVVLPSAEGATNGPCMSPGA